MLSFSYYLHEKAEESRHNETVGLLVSVIGCVLLVGGILQTVLMIQTVQWFLIFPYQPLFSPYGFLGLGFTLLGIILFLGGIVLAVHYGAQRSWYGSALKESYRIEERKLRAQKKGQSETDIFLLPTAEATETQSHENIREVKPKAHP